MSHYKESQSRLVCIAQMHHLSIVLVIIISIAAVNTTVGIIIIIIIIIISSSSSSSRSSSSSSSRRIIIIIIIIIIVVVTSCILFIILSSSLSTLSLRLSHLSSPSSSFLSTQSVLFSQFYYRLCHCHSHNSLAHLSAHQINVIGIAFSWWLGDDPLLSNAYLVLYHSLLAPLRLCHCRYLF